MLVEFEHEFVVVEVGGARDGDGKVEETGAFAPHLHTETIVDGAEGCGVCGEGVGRAS